MTGPRILRLVALAALWSVIFFGAGRMVQALVRAAPAAALPVAYAETAACSPCPGGLRLTSVQVEARRDSTLFLIRGNWPATAGAIPDDIILVANDVGLLLRGHKSSTAFEIVSARKGSTVLGPSAIAVSLRPGVLLVNISRSALSTPIRFQLALVNNSHIVDQLPATGQLMWDGSGRPHK